MSLNHDLYPSSLLATMEAARRFSAPIEAFKKRHVLLREAGLWGADRPRTALDYAAFGRDPFSDRMRAIDALSSAHAALGLGYRDFFPQHLLDQANRFNDIAQALSLPDALERFRTPPDVFLDRVLLLSRPELGLSRPFLDAPTTVAAFARASAVADMFAETDRLTRGVREAAGLFSIMPTMHTTPAS